ncbi:DUF2155 domain-containing protein [Mariprofundus sp. EBB-1]|uniref:DUF2155 domain-containing protein n=1 Tax=Mariprofundus sp. EBB-1 TaxID=2650971 RepID=UPI000EF24C27|nr:DUF2155 domain-containing protein [Mariprofundus sp. EBB-1]RLL54019.1 DUF2155 domain-containing protein [Mariprofundus sp. EBB-1]
MKRINLLTHSLLIIAVGFFITACEQQQAEQIEWQLPLAAPEDPHGSKNQVNTIPDWAVARQGEAEVVWLEKNTTQRFTTKLALGGSSHLKNWDIQLLGLASGLRVQNSAFINDENVDNAAALVELRRDGELIYRGWLYEQFPELFGMDNPEWKVWLKGITLRPAEKEE